MRPSDPCAATTFSSALRVDGDGRFTLTGIDTVFVVMISTIVAIDLLFFKHRFWERLAVNIGIVLVFGACYFRFLKRP